MLSWASCWLPGVAPRPVGGAAAVGERRRSSSYFLDAVGRKVRDPAAVLLRIVLDRVDAGQRLVFALDDTPPSATARRCRARAFITTPRRGRRGEVPLRPQLGRAQPDRAPRRLRSHRSAPARARGRPQEGRAAAARGGAGLVPDQTRERRGDGHVAPHAIATATAATLAGRGRLLRETGVPQTSAAGRFRGGRAAPQGRGVVRPAAGDPRRPETVSGPPADLRQAPPQLGQAPVRSGVGRPSRCGPPRVRSSPSGSKRSWRPGGRPGAWCGW